MLARAKAVSSLNAMIYLNEDKAMAAARQVDADRAAGKKLGALAGLPIVVKDNINTKDMKTTGGTPSLRNFQPSKNAPSVQKLIDAGAIVLGKSNLHEWAFGITSTNFTLGTDQSGGAARPCKNPYDSTRIPGGSSGGTAAAIAARLWPVSDPRWAMAKAKAAATPTPSTMPCPSAPPATRWGRWPARWPTWPCWMP
jgi:mandelamide amidase